jgi:hypothetical protein
VHKENSFMVNNVIYSPAGLLFEILDENGHFLEFIKCENICEELKNVIGNSYPEVLI